MGFDKKSVTQYLLLGLAAIATRLVSKQVPALVEKQSAALGEGAKYATPAVLFGLGLVIKKFMKGNEVARYTSDIMIGNAVADLFAVTFPGVIQGLESASPMQALPGYDFQTRMIGPNQAVPFPSSLQGIPERVPITREPGDFRNAAY